MKKTTVNHMSLCNCNSNTRYHGNIVLVSLHSAQPFFLSRGRTAVNLNRSLQPRGWPTCETLYYIQSSLWSLSETLTFSSRLECGYRCAKGERT